MSSNNVTFMCIGNVTWRGIDCWLCSLVKGKGSPYSTAKHRVPDLIPVLAVSLQMTWVINPVVGCHYFPPGLQLLSQLLRGLLPISLLGEQRHDGCEQFARDCYLAVSWLRFEPRPFCAWVQHANHLATEPPCNLVHWCKSIRWKYSALFMIWIVALQALGFTLPFHHIFFSSG